VSRIGKKPVDVPSGVTISLSGEKITVKGPKGELSRHLHPAVPIKIEGSKIKVGAVRKGRGMQGLHGLTRTLIQNMVTGVSKGFTRVMEVNGVGYRVEVKQGALYLMLGFSHPLEILLPKGVTAKVEKNVLEIWGIDREVVGQLAAVIRDQRPPEVYKGKGIKYSEETIRRKVGKAGASSSG
jgi:large subunit ribosomal protein L6